MLLKSRTRVDMKKEYFKILYLYPAYNDTFVFLGMHGLRRDCAVHVDKEGNIISEHLFTVPMDSMGMLSDRECIFIETRSKWNLCPVQAQEHGTNITVWDLQTHTFKRTPFYFVNEQTDQAFIHTFAESKLLCIREDGRYNDNRFKLSYFNYPLKENDKPFNIFNAKDNEWTYEYITKQANQHSMMAWFKARQDNEWEFRTYDLRDDTNGKLNIYKFKQEAGVPYGLTNVQVALNTMWETTKNCFMLVCISNKQEEHKNKEQNVIQNNFICDTKTGTVRQAKFSFKEHQDLLIDQRSMGPTSMFRTFDFKDGKPLPTPIFYVDNEKEEIVSQDTWECSYLHKDEPTGVDSGMLIHNEYENGDCKWFVCESVKVVNQKELTLFFMLQMNPNFDEDLLQDVVEMIGDAKN